MVFLSSDSSFVLFLFVFIDLCLTESSDLSVSSPSLKAPYSGLLAVNTTRRVYFAKYSRQDLERGDRLVVEGLAQHPFVKVVTSPDLADVILCMPWHSPQVCNPYSQHKKKLVVVDFQDLPTFHFPLRAAGVYFKRSIAIRKLGRSISLIQAPHLFAIQYGAQIHHSLPMDGTIPYLSRNLTIWCTIAKRPNNRRRNAPNDGGRRRVRDWMDLFASQLPTPYTSLVSYVDVNKYLTLLRQTRIVVTAMPNMYEGDSRLWEGLAAGALVFCDKMLTPQPPEVMDGVHAIFYDNANKTDLFTKLWHYIRNPEEAAKIAQRGWLLALNYHRGLNRADYILWTSQCFQQHGNHTRCMHYPIGSKNTESPILLPRPPLVLSTAEGRYGQWSGPQDDHFTKQIRHFRSVGSTDSSLR